MSYLDYGATKKLNENCVGDVKPFITPTCVFVKEFGIFFLNMITNSVLQSVYCRVNRKSMKYVLSN